MQYKLEILGICKGGIVLSMLNNNNNNNNNNKNKGTDQKPLLNFHLCKVGYVIIRCL